MAVFYLLPEATELIDDHFMHVVWGRQLLYGRLFIRDMVPIGLPLQSALSAVFEWMFGYRLLSEGLIIALTFAIGAVLTFVLARRASGSTGIGMLAGVFQLAIAPRTYSYPKIVLYAAAILALWRYIDQPSRRRFTLIVAVVALGFYLRHDHGLYLGIVAAGVLGLRHARDGQVAARRLVALAAVCTLATVPYLVYAHVHSGVASYVNDLRGFATREHQQNHFDGWPKWPLASLDDVVQWPADPPNATIGVRWNADAPQDARRAAAARYSLNVGDGQPIESGRFQLTDISIDNVIALIGDPLIEDTSGLDRPTGVVSRQGLRIGTSQLLAGLDAPAASAAFLFYVFIALLPITLIGLARMRAEELATRLVHVKIMAVLLVGIVSAIGFLREPLTIRIADAVVAPLVLAAFWAGRALRSGDTPANRDRRLLATVIAAVVILIPTLRSVVVVGAVPSRIERVQRFPAVWQRLSVSPPFEGWQATGSAKYQAVRYVRECTSPGDPLLVLWFAPDIYYYSGRPFAGRLGFYMEGYWASADHERSNIAGIERDHPTIVLMEPGRRATDLYTYPQLLAYVSTFYHVLGELRSSDGARVRVHARNDRTPWGVDAETGWPCFAPARETRAAVPAPV